MTEPYPYPSDPTPGGGQGPQYGQQPGQQFGPPPDNNLVWAILCTVLCCLPFGVVAIVKANEVNTLWYQGFHDRARESAEAAKKWALWGALSQVIVLVVIGVIWLIMALWVWQTASHMPNQF